MHKTSVYITYKWEKVQLCSGILLTYFNRMFIIPGVNPRRQVHPPSRTGRPVRLRLSRQAQRALSAGVAVL